ncbi:MAG: RecB family exonuclease [Actinomycetes bacterium]
MSIPIPKSISPSSISQFQSCPLAFRFAYIERLPQDPSPAASKGTLVHRALELLMQRDAPERTLEAALADLVLARAQLADDPDFAGLDLTDDEWTAFHADAEVLVRRYFDLEDPTTIEPIGLELKLEATVGRATVRGVIDRLERDAAGRLVVSDYKTGRAPHPNYQSQRLAGVNLYALMVAEHFGELPARVQLLHLQEPVAIVAETSEQQARGVGRRTEAVWDAIGTACQRGEFRPKASKLCDWCSFRQYCPEFGGDPQAALDLVARDD